MSDQPNPWRRPSDEAPPKDGTKIDVWHGGFRQIDLWWQDDCVDCVGLAVGPGWMGDWAGPDNDCSCLVLNPDEVEFWMPRPADPAVG